MREKFCTRKSCMWIRIASQQIDDFEKLCSGSVTSCGGWHAGKWLSRLGSQRSASVRWRCTCSFESPACLQILCGAILARQAARRVVLTKHSWLSFYRSPHSLMPRKLNTPLLLFSDLGGGFLDQVLCFLYCGARKAFLGHFGHIQCQAHVGLFLLYPTSLPCNSSRHVEYLQDSSCCF